MPAKTGRVYEFGDFRLDPAEKILFCEDKPVPLRPKVFDMLQLFVENPGHLLNKQELMEAIWQNRFVEESNLTFSIKMLRRVLQDDPRAPRFIETVPRRGYRFIAEVRETSAVVTTQTALENGNAGPSLPPVTTSPLPAGGFLSRLRGSYFVVLAVLLFTVVAAVVGAWWGRVRRTTFTDAAPILSAPFKSEKFPSGGGSSHAVITPDGEYVAYSSEGQSKQSLWLRQLKSAENIQIVPPMETNYLGLAVSHDGKSLYFTRTLSDHSAIFRVGTFGGIPVKLVEKTEGWIGVSPDDRQLSFARCYYHEDDYCSLFVADVDGKNERRLFTRQKPYRIVDGQFSPDGKSIAFASGQSWTGGNDFRLLRFDLATGKEVEITPTRFFNVKSLKWLPDGSGLLVVVKEVAEGRARIWHVSTVTGAARRLTNDATDYTTLSLDRAANRMVATRVTNTFHLYVGAVDDLDQAKPLDAAINGFSFTPEGKIVYAGSDANLWMINPDGAEQRQLTNSPAIEIFPRVGADGRYIFFSSNQTGTNQIWRMNSDGSTQIQLTRTEGGHPRFVSSDGRWVYFESSLNQTFRRVAADGSGEETQVLPGRVTEPVLSADGKLLAYFAGPGAGNQLVVMSIDGRQIVNRFSLANEVSEPGRIAWAPDNRNLFYTTVKAGKNSLWQQPLDRTLARLIADFGDEELGEFALSRDGKSFAFIRGKWIREAVLIEGLR